MAENKKENEIQFIKDNMIDLIPIAKKIKENEIERLRQGDIDSLTKKERNILTNKNIKENEIEKGKIIILDDNELSILSYAEEYPENWKKICEALDKKRIEQNGK